MRFQLALSILIALALAASLAAQTKLSGTLQCQKSDPVYSIPVGDRPDHVLTLSKTKCTWAKPPQIAGLAAKEHEYIASGDVAGSRLRTRTAAFGAMENGDRYFTVTQGTGALKEGVIQTAEGTWSYTGGTGKLKGLKGKGTFKGKATPDGTFTIEVEGEYQLP